MRSKILAMAFAASALGTGCKDRSVAVHVDAGSDGGTCTAFATEHEALLNAPTDAAVVRKPLALPALPGGDVPRPLPPPADPVDAGADAGP